MSAQRSHARTSWHLLGLVTLSGLLLASCSGSREGAGPLSPVSGKHPEGWRTAHHVDYVKNPAGCVNCHGSTKDPAHAGGPSRVSCFSCHGSPDHPQGWGVASQHGRLGAMAAPTAFAGMASCTKCHGTDYRQGIGTTPSCTSCHTKAPHPGRPWSGPGSGHVLTEPANAAACYTCHADGANSLLKPASKPPAGTAPGCFNNTMCHGREI